MTEESIGVLRTYKYQDIKTEIDIKYYGEYITSLQKLIPSGPEKIIQKIYPTWSTAFRGNNKFDKMALSIKIEANVNS